MPSRTRRYSGSDRPAWRMNHTGVCGTGSRRQARRKAESRSASAVSGAGVVTGADGVTLVTMTLGGTDGASQDPLRRIGGNDEPDGRDLAQTISRRVGPTVERLPEISRWR